MLRAVFSCQVPVMTGTAQAVIDPTVIVHCVTVLPSLAMYLWKRGERVRKGFSFSRKNLKRTNHSLYSRNIVRDGDGLG
jgi:hypothetical protein